MLGNFQTERDFSILSSPTQSRSFKPIFFVTTQLILTVAVRAVTKDKEIYLKKDENHAEFY